MASDLISIARSGVQTARIALDVTAQNIANASTEGYVRRSVQLGEVALAGTRDRVSDMSFSGVRLSAVVRNADAFRQSEVRRTGSDASRAVAELTGLENIETAVEQTGVHQSIVNFEASLEQLAANPIDPSLRAAVVEDARTMARTFNIAATSLDSVGQGLRFEAADGAAQVDLLAKELARVNTSLTRARDGGSDKTVLLDKRDNLLQQLSEYVDVTTTIGGDGQVEVRIGGPTGPQLVSTGTAYGFAMTTATDGTIGFTLDGDPVTPLSGSLAGQAQALTKLADVRARLDTIAASVITTVNAAQANGVALDGTAGQPMFTGTGAGNIAIAFGDGKLIATAPAGAGANSRDPANLDALRTAFTNADATGWMDALLFDVSSSVAGRKITLEALDSIAGTARIALSAQAGVDLDQEAVNLVRFQQAFQASGRVMQVASDLFDTLIGIR